MPATEARIARITRQFLPVVSGPRSDIASAYGNAARDNLDPVETFFETSAGAQAMADERLALLGTPRRRFAVGVADATPVLSLSFDTTAPTAQVVDDTRAVSGAGIITGYTANLATNDATVKVMV